GATSFLNRCPGHVGRYLGLTGARLGASDALYCGFATHFVTQERIADFVAALGRIGWRPSGEHRQLEQLVADFAGDPGPAPLVARQEAIDRSFAGETVEAILGSLAREAATGRPEAEWAKKTRETLLTKSPTSL